MNLLQIRKKFRELSGRFDLVNTDFTDNGADFFINEGRKYLDRLDKTQKSFASAFKFVNVGKYIVSIKYCRAINEVWISTGTERWQLEKMDLRDLLNEYLSGDPSLRLSGEPIYYSPTITRYIPEDLNSESFEAFIGMLEIPAGNANEYNTLLLNIPTSVKLMVEVKGLFYSNELVNDTDKNYWSEVHPLLLYMSAMRYIEVVNRNTQGVNDWSNAIATDMTAIGMDLVEEEISEIEQIGD